MKRNRIARLCFIVGHLALALPGTLMLGGCGGDEGSGGTPTQVGEDPNAAKRQQEMKDFMEKQNKGGQAPK